MRSQIFLCLFVGLTYATNGPAWRDNTEYVYQVRGRSLTGFPEVENVYSGILLKAKLVIRAQPDGDLSAKIEEPQYARLHIPLPQGWKQNIPDSQLPYQPLLMSQQPFQIKMRNGAVSDVIVDQDMSNWEANIIKSIVSQFQLDTRAENLITSHYNILTQDYDSGVFKTMEETVTGVAETLYEIHPLPDYVQENKPYLVPHPELNREGKLIEIVKSKNFSRSERSPSYHYGFGQSGFADPTKNQLGDFFSRSSVSHAVVTGNLNGYTIQSSHIVEEISMRPTLSDKQKGWVRTILNMTLESVQEQSQPLPSPSNPVRLGSLVYKYDNPFSTSNKVLAGANYEHNAAPASAEAFEERTARPWRYRRDTKYMRNYAELSSESEYESSENDVENWTQKQPRLGEAPASPLLPFTVGYQGQSFKKQKNIIEEVRKLAQKIAQELEHPEQVPEQNTAGKFVTLSSLLRIMDQNEVEQVASQLYNKDHHSREGVAWIVYRDAVAQAGTGPALTSIQEWIKSDKISGGTAAHVVASAAESARQPTIEYMRAFQQMVTSPKVMSQETLNETALLAFTSLVHSVYVDQQQSQGNYPTHSFGSFYNTQGKTFLKQEVIPHLTEKLNQAITQTDTEKIHVYIRALGNIGYKRILEAFEPYLEGRKQASQFQRFLMVVALDELAKSDPKVARSVLYKIYQNPSENQQVRVAAVYQLMRTNPPANMLQRMASYTKQDSSEYVNSAVKSSIETAAELKGAEFEQLRDAARSAEPSLTPKEYGQQYPKNYLRSYVSDEIKLSYKQTFQTLGDEDSYIPEAARYSLRAKFGGVRQQIFKIQGMTSSIDDLVNVLEQQTEWYKKEKSQKQSEGGQNQKWSSENIAKLLDMKFEQREQLEGYLYAQIGSLQKVLSLDNRTIESLPQILKEVEQTLQNGKHFHLKRFYMDEERTISFPTALGLPFIYTYDKPIIVNIEGELKATVSPALTNGKQLQIPEHIEAQLEIRGYVSGKTQSQFGIITPFDGQRYSAGYDKNFQVEVPLTGKFDVDVHNMQAKVEIKWNEQQQNQDLHLHYSSWPYTSQDDIYTPQPNRQVIRNKYPQKIDKVFGQDCTGIAVHVQVTSDRAMDVAWIYEKLQHKDPVSALLSPWVDDNIQHTEINLRVDSQMSSTKKVAIKMGYQHKYFSGRSSGSKSFKPEEFKNIPDEPLKRQSEFLKRIAYDITSAHARATYVQFAFQGQQEIKHDLTVVSAKSNVDPTGRVLVHGRMRNAQGQTHEIGFTAKSHIPNTNGLDADFAMKLDPTSYTNIQGFIGNELSKFSAKVEFRKSEERKQELMMSPEYQEFQREMNEGNHQLPASAKFGAEANLLDQFELQVQYKDVDPAILNATYKLCSFLRHMAYPRIEENLSENAGLGKEEVQIHGQFFSNLNAVNVSVSTKRAQVHFYNIAVNEMAKQIFVPHPVFHIRSRIMGKVYNTEVYRPFCVIDKTAAATFDNKTYPAQLTQDWTVLLQYTPQRPASQEQSQQQNQQPLQSVEEKLSETVDNYVVLARASQAGSSQKEVKIVMQTPETNQKVVEINLKPTSPGQYPKVYVEKDEIKYTSEEASDLYNGALQVYGLPNSEVKFEIYKAFYVIYDGVRAKLTIVDNKFRGASRGLCGTFDGESQTDFLSPRNCMLHTPEDFIQSYTMSAQSQQNQEQCHYKKVMYADVISRIDTGRMTAAASNAVRATHGGASCTKHQTQYVEENGQICFTLRPLPVCKQSCNKNGVINKEVPVHCIQSSNAAQLWKNEIDKGASPDFSLKTQTRTIRWEIPLGCSK